MSDTFPDYSHFPRELSGHLPIEEAVEKLSQEYGRILNAWLEWCVEQWCPEAMECYRNGDSRKAILVLGYQEFYYACLPNDIYEFRQGNNVLARCKIEWAIKSKLEEAK